MPTKFDSYLLFYKDQDENLEFVCAFYMNDHNQIKLNNSHEHLEKPSDTKLVSFFKQHKNFDYALKYPERQPIIKKASIPIGKYYPRMFRPLLISNIGITDHIGRQNPIPFNHLSENKLNIQITYILKLTEEIFQTVYPSLKNKNVYGISIKSLLLLTCTEIESQMLEILSYNEYVKKNRYTTKDFVKLNALLKLNRYSFSLKNYNEFRHISPFKKWNTKFPTKSLKWFHANNELKHSGHLNFEKAHISNLISSITALIALYVAQFGKESFSRSNLDKFVTIVKEPEWESSEKYIQPFGTHQWEEVNCLNLS